MGFFSGNVKRAREYYYKFVIVCDNENKKAHYDFKDEKSQYRSERTVLERNFKPGEIVDFIVKYTNIDKKMIRWKYKREAKESRALCIFLIRYYCDFTYKQICSVIGRLTLSRVTELSKIGLGLIEKDERYKNIMEEFIKGNAA
jgi:DNA modification methylase